ncbi:MAG: tyrosine-type recombinase/integrase [Kiritimatiellales bacterium]|nr:tyrosine-type recombinase/integrase [Kiritimatiellales bacterium]
METTKITTERKRGKRGLGRLYIRNKHGKEFKARTPINPSENPNGLCYWLEYQKPTGKLSKDEETGKETPLKKKTRVKLLDSNGDPITTISAAEDARERIVLQYVTAKSRADLIKKIDKELAEAKAELEGIEVIHAKAIEDANPTLTIEDAWAKFEGHHNLDCGETLIYNYRSHWKQFRKFLGADYVYMKDVFAKTAEEYARHLLKRRVSHNTYNKHINFLKLIYSLLSDEIGAEVSPFAGINTKKLSAAKKKGAARLKKRRELSREELSNVIDKAEGDLQTLLMLGAYSGLRLGDCCTLRHNEVLLDKGLIKRVPNKTQGDPIQIGIPLRLINRLSETPKSQRKGYVLPKFAEAYNYANEDGKHSHRTRITNRIQKHFETCGITTHADGTGFKLVPDGDGGFDKVYTGKRAIVEVGFHSLRHTFVGLQAEQGTSMSVIQKIVSHSSQAMTDHYLHISEEAAIGATLKLDDCVQDAEFEVLPEPLPDWARELAEKLNAENWETIKEQLLANAGGVK